MAKEAKEFVGFRLPGDLLNRVDAVAEDQGISRTEVLVRCIRLGIEDEERTNASMKNPLLAPLMDFILQPSVARKIAVLVGEEYNPERFAALKRVKEKAKSSKSTKTKEA